MALYHVCSVVFHVPRVPVLGGGEGGGEGGSEGGGDGGGEAAMPYLSSCSRLIGSPETTGASDPGPAQKTLCYSTTRRWMDMCCRFSTAIAAVTGSVISVVTGVLHLPTGVRRTRCIAPPQRAIKSEKRGPRASAETRARNNQKNE